MGIIKNSKVNVLLLGVIMMAILMCCSSPAKASQEGDYSFIATSGGGGGGVITSTPDTTSILIDNAGTFGPATGSQNVSNITISVSGVVLQNSIISGDLLISEGVGSGDVTLQNVTVKGITTINGGGENSIHIDNCTLGQVIVNKTDGKLRIVLSGTTSIKELVADSAVNVVGLATIDKATINAMGVIIEATPSSTIIANNITVTVAGTSLTGTTTSGGCGGGGASGGGGGSAETPSTTESYTYTVTDGKATITKYTGAGGDVTIPSTLGGYPVTSIGTGAFRGCSSLISISLPNSVTSIGDEAFGWCHGLTNVYFPQVLHSIGRYAFFNCTNLASISLPDSVNSIGDFAFACCDKIASIDISYNLTQIGINSFGGCQNLSAINVEEANPVYVSENGVLFNKAKTELIQCPEEKSGNYNIPVGIIIVGRCAFGGCDKLTSIDIPDSVVSIGDYAFASCWNLTTIRIPSNISSIGKGALQGSRNIAVITVDLNNATYASEEGVLFNKAMTEIIQCPGGKSGSYDIPDSVTNISNEAFFSCNRLTSISIPESVTSIGFQAFNSCDGLKTITIPKSVTSIGYNAFYDCNNLFSAYFYGNAPDVGDDVFGATKSGFTVYYLSDKTGFTNPWYGYPAVGLENIAVTGITLNKSATSITAGWYEKITATVSPENAAIKDVIWSVRSESGSNVARVSSSGIIVGMNPGTAVIRATSAADASKYAECSVTVISEPAYDHFNQGEGHEAGAYDPQAQQPMAFNWSRQSAFSGPEYPSKKWEFQVRNSSFRAWFQPVIGSDGTIYAGSDDTKLYAIKPDGTLKWTFTTAGNIQGCPSIGRNGVLYVVSGDYLFAVDNNGNEIWRAELGSNLYGSYYVYGSPAIDSDGTIYCMGSSGLYAVSVYGEILWSNKLVSGASSPVIGKDGSVYIATDNTLYSIKTDGSINWVYHSTADEYSAMDERVSTPTIGSDGKIYAVFYGRITAINPDGTEYKKYDAFFDGHSYRVGDSSATPAISSDGSMYLGFKEVRFICYESDGKIKWINDLNSEYYHRSSPVIDKNGVIYICSMLGQNIGNLYAFNSDGSKKWKFACNTELEGAPAIGADGTVYVGTGNGKIIAIGIGQQVSDFIYSVSNDNITITDYIGTGGDVAIPAIIDGKSVISIDEDAFVDCTGLTSIGIPQSVISIGDRAFGNCTKLASITFDSATTTIYDDENTIPASTKIIGYDPSSAKDYAAKYNRTFEVLSAKPVDECFIATAAFGSKFTWPVALLRHFRDEYLLTNSWGTTFVNFYYHNSPPIASYIADSEPLKVLVRMLLLPFIALVYLIFHPIWGIIVIGFGVLIFLLMRIRRKAVNFG